MNENKQTMMEMLSDWVRSVFVKQFGDELDLSKIGAVETGDSKFGDYQCNAAMSLAGPARR